MRALLPFILFLSLPLFASARPVVLLSYYDVFGKGEFNNSEKVAKALAESLGTDGKFELKLCALPTAYDRGYAALEDCYKSLPTTPILYLGLGEYGCSMKIETMVRNLDKNLKLPDNDGNLRHQVIIPGAPKVIGVNLPAPEMYCSLSKEAREDIEVSNSAGSFVCNNTAFQFGHYYADVPSGFIHVPGHHCKGLGEKTKAAVGNLRLMLEAAVKTLAQNGGAPKRQPLTKSELEPLRNDKSDKCRGEFFKRSKTAEQAGLWSILSPN